MVMATVMAGAVAVGAATVTIPWPPSTRLRTSFAMDSMTTAMVVSMITRSKIARTAIQALQVRARQVETHAAAVRWIACRWRVRRWSCAMPWTTTATD